MDKYIIDESIWGITYNDENEPVTLSIWFKGDKRDGVQEVFWKCDNPPSDIDNKAAILDLIWDKTGMSSLAFKNAKFTRVENPIHILTMENDGGDIVRCYDHKGDLALVIEGKDVPAMIAGGLDPYNDEDLFTYANHLLGDRFASYVSQVAPVAQLKAFA